MKINDDAVIHFEMRIKKKCIYHYTTIIYERTEMEAVGTSCPAEDFYNPFSESDSWVYCPWCGRKVEWKNEERPPRMGEE